MTSISGMLEDFNRQMAKLNASDTQLLKSIDKHTSDSRTSLKDSLAKNSSRDRKFSLDSRTAGLTGNAMTTRHMHDEEKLHTNPPPMDTLPVQPIKQTLERLVSPVIDQTMQQQQLLIQQQQQLIQLQKEQNKLQQNLQEQLRKQQETQLVREQKLEKEQKLLEQQKKLQQQFQQQLQQPASTATQYPPVSIASAAQQPSPVHVSQQSRQQPQPTQINYVDPMLEPMSADYGEVVTAGYGPYGQSCVASTGGTYRTDNQTSRHAAKGASHSLPATPSKKGRQKHTHTLEEN